MAPRKAKGGGGDAPRPPPAAAAVPPALGTSSSDDDDDAGEVQIDPAQAERLMALEQELEKEAPAYDTHVEVRKAVPRERHNSIGLPAQPRTRAFPARIARGRAS
jgi:hypothetical protein